MEIVEHHHKTPNMDHKFVLPDIWDKYKIFLSTKQRQIQLCSLTNGYFFLRNSHHTYTCTGDIAGSAACHWLAHVHVVAKTDGQYFGCYSKLILNCAVYLWYSKFNFVYLLLFLMGKKMRFYYNCGLKNIHRNVSLLITRGQMEKQGSYYRISRYIHIPSIKGGCTVLTT